MNLSLNPNLLNTCKSATLAINEKSKELVSQGKTVYRLGLGQSPFPVPDIMVESLKEHASVKDYLAVQGLLPLREAISGYLKRTDQLDFKADQIIVAPGSKELMYILQNVLNTDLLLPAPSWVSYQPQAKLCGLECHWINCKASNNWNITAQDIALSAEQNPNARLLILNAPNNPSGGCFTPSELQAIADVARQYQLIVLSDEIYSELNFKQSHTSLAHYYPEGTIISNGISKWAGAGGWRLGFMAIPEPLSEVTEAMTVFASETYTSVSAPIQFAAIKAFEESVEMENYINTARTIMNFVTQSFSQKLTSKEIICPVADGGFYVLCLLEKQQQKIINYGIQNSAQLCEHLLADVGVACLPGSDFGINNSDFAIRFALVDFDGEAAMQDYKARSAQSLSEDNPIYKSIFEATELFTHWIENL